MEDRITCPNCKKILPNSPVIDDAAKGGGASTQSITCENCGEIISYWKITAQLREQKVPLARILNWLRSLSKSQA
jgi:RNase P subunit RPR2